MNLRPRQGTEKSDRIPLIDLFRFLEATAVVWIHTAESQAAKDLVPGCRIAVPFFTASFVAFGLRQLRSTKSVASWCAFVGRKFQKIYLPFLAWSAIYLALRLCKHQFFGTNSTIILGPSTLLVGTAHHLWFLPFAMGIAMALPLLRNVYDCRLSCQILACICFLLAPILGLTPFPLAVSPEVMPSSYFAAMAWTALPSALLVVPFALHGPTRFDKPTLSLAGIGLLLLIPCLYIFPENNLLPCFGGVLLWIFGHVNTPCNLSSHFVLLGKLSFGIYLTHVAFVEAFQAAGKLVALSPSLKRDVLIAALSTGLSIAATSALAKSTRLRWMLPS